ncbi:MAG TPA: CopG family transcriptional regulator [Spirochaetota bacterium]|nr:CopG family transcriptional regulator [Spirochaetota bacterium]HOH37460.1 CopG family transcriptional regulator [Spirochaetota bacterium]HPJ13623.1 CopG family transcriptional regulator [Spirochaetota bacterium]HPM33164.1 CopG family transcriptional regulator [Spirochaetota bacterium]HPY04393.1 CopG family transcriptional regulator [Spirochaetota bacterium]
MLSIRLSSEIESKLDQISKTENKPKSEIIKSALDLYFKKYHEVTSPYELGKDLFGKAGSGQSNSSKDYKSILKGKLREKHSR